MLEGNKNDELFNKLSEDVWKAVEDFPTERPSEGQRQREGRNLRSTTGETTADDRSIATIVTEVMKALQPMMVQCILTAVTRAMSLYTSEIRDEIRKQKNSSDSTVLADIKKQTKLQSYQLEKMEQFHRRDNIRIKGLMYEEGEDTTDVQMTQKQSSTT